VNGGAPQQASTLPLVHPDSDPVMTQDRFKLITGQVYVSIDLISLKVIVLT